MLWLLFLGQFDSLKAQSKKNSTAAPLSSITLKWGQVPGVKGYLVELSERSDFATVLTSQTVLDPFLSFGEEKLTLYVRITAIGMSGAKGPPSSVVSLKEYSERFREESYESDSFVNPSERLEIFFGDSNSKKGESIAAGNNSESTPKTHLPRKTFFRIDKGEWLEYKGSIPLVKEGWADVEFYSEDIVGNREEVRTVRVLKDTTPPQVIWNPKKIGNSGLPEYRSGDSINFAIQEAGSGLRYLEAEIKSESPSGRKIGVRRIREFDGSPPVFKGEYKIPESLQEGVWILRWISEDKAGNKKSGEFPLMVDQKGPTCEIVLPGLRKENNIFLLNSGSEVHLFCSDEYSGVKEIKVSIQGSVAKEFQYTAPFHLPIGKSTLSIRAADHVGNASDFSYKIEVLDPNWEKNGTKIRVQRTED
ncbi:S-layer protein [Leptospira inadai serovar Lyme]|uniref:S-layer protein n=1 Tax=Leptospira inadai serovar Lyme TaxID=293084 RepID=A0ABX4YI30_9LEPT|nr:S-layer protein [Leptospira inadai serovar Lyme]